MLGLDNHLEELVALEPIELFFKYLPQQYLSHVANMSSLYAQQKGSSLDVTWEEIGQFFGILLFSGYHTVPQENLYWCSAEDMSIPIIPSVMPRNHFKDIKRYFHLSDNNMLQKGDKLGKISPLYRELGKNLMQFGIFHKELSLNESMVPYYGHHPSKMFIKGKPIRFGYKIWMLCSSSGYPYAMQIYAGKEKNSTGPLGSRVVCNLLAVVEHPKQIELYVL